jgi:hypothetical protein
MNDKVKPYVTPVLKVLYTNLMEARANQFYPNNPPTFSVKTSIDGSTPEGMQLKKLIRAANPKYVKTSKTDENGDTVVFPNGEFHVEFKADAGNPPKVYIKNSDTGAIELVKGKDIPYINANKYGDVAEAVVGFTIVDKVSEKHGPYQVMRLSAITFTSISLGDRAKSAGASISNQEYADEEIEKLMKAAV